MAADQETGTGMSFVLGQHEYRVDDLTLNDVAEIEDRHGESLGELFEAGRIGPLLHMAWCIRRKSEPGLTLEQVGEVTMGEMAAEREAAAGPPTEAAGKRKKSEGGGGRGSRASTASGRGNSDS